jgi:O-glycosyl hydrolase
MKKRIVAGVFSLALVCAFFINCNKDNEESGNKDPDSGEPGNEVNAGKPHITGQPQDAIYLQNETVTALTITASEPEDGGTLSYQWYSNTTNTNSGGTEVEGATSASWQPANITPNTPNYYYVVVTSTNSQESTTATSSVVSIFVDTVSNALVAVDTATKYQYVRGFGAMDTPGDQNFSAIPADHFDSAYNPTTGLGLNILRIYIPPGNTNIRTTMNTYASSTRPQYYQQIRKVNQWGGYVFASPWTPPAVWKNNNSTNGDDSVKGGERTAFLKPANYQDYANYLKEFCLLLAENNAPIYAVSIQNEPNYSEASYTGCLWTGAEMRDFFKQVGHFTDGTTGYGGGKAQPHVRTMNGESANTPVINDEALDDPVSRAAIDILTRHTYGEGDVYFRYDKGFEYDKEIWMTEKCVNNDHQPIPGWTNGHDNTATWNHVWRFMNDVDMVIRLNEQNVYTAYPLRRFYSLIGDDTRFGSPGAGAILPRGYGLSHYAKFAKETWRVNMGIRGTTGTKSAITGANVNNTEFDYGSTAVKISAYVSADGNTISLIMWTPTDHTGAGGTNMGTMRIQLPSGFVATGATAMRSTSANGGKTVTETVTLSPDGKSAAITLPASNILSVRFTK